MTTYSPVKHKGNRIINILMYTKIVCCETPIYLRISIYLAKNRELSELINTRIYIIEKSKKIDSEKL